jgi:hypothetical protein
VAGERWYLGEDLLWHRKGWPDGEPGGSPSNPTNPSGPLLQVAQMSLAVTASAPTPTPDPVPPDPTPTPTPDPTTPPTPLPAGTRYFGACPDHLHSGANTTAAQAVLTKYGTNASVRLFHGPGAFAQLPVHPAGASVVHTSWKIGSLTSSVLSGAQDAALTAWINAARNGDIIEIAHESDVERNGDAKANPPHIWTAQEILTRIKVKNYLYDLKQKIKPGVLVAHTTAAYLFGNQRTDAQRDEWFATARGDLIGIDCDGAHDTTGPTYGIDYGPAVANAKRYVTKYKANGFKGYTVPEFGTSRQPWDPSGNVRSDWFAAQSAKMTGAYLINVYDFNSGTHTTATNFNYLPNPSPELTTMRNLVRTNP